MYNIYHSASNVRHEHRILVRAEPMTHDWYHSIEWYVNEASIVVEVAIFVPVNGSRSDYCSIGKCLFNYLFPRSL